MAEYIIDFNEALYNKETGECCFHPTIKGELVRCKDCHYAKPFNEVFFKPMRDTVICNRLNYDVDLDYFCADGVRKDA